MMHVDVGQATIRVGDTFDDAALPFLVDNTSGAWDSVAFRDVSLITPGQDAATVEWQMVGDDADISDGRANLKAGDSPGIPQHESLPLWD